MVKVDDKNMITELLYGLNFYPVVFIIQLFFLINYSYWFGVMLDPFVILLYIIMPPCIMVLLLFMGSITLNKRPFLRTPLAKGTVHLLLGIMVTWAIMLAIVFAFNIEVGRISSRYAMPILMFQLLLVAPSEEMTFRALIPKMFSNLRYRYRMIASQIIFASFHLVAYRGEWNLLFFAFIFGCLLLFLADRYGLPLTIGIHFAYNCVMLGILSGGVVV